MPCKDEYTYVSIYPITPYKTNFSGNSARGFSIIHNLIKHTVFYKNIHQQNTNLKNIFLVPALHTPECYIDIFTSI